jgi:homopolymeric O-antigen transport system ATP-binding protein
MPVAIQVEGLGKRYRIGARRAAYSTFRDALTRAALAPWRRLRSFGRSSHRAEDSVWALRDATFDVKQGQVLGVIGRNGAGKSTLLKLLTRITDPTEGRAVLNGRVGSLLEVGTGFHPELTGRENIFLSGAVLGMKRREIRDAFDEIVAFSGIEQFLETPVKRYSSGMAVRLGFAVAAHLTPEILLIDEVLAVGDAAFRQKCLGKMGEVAQTGRTVLFVSHNMGAVADLCEEAILLDGGRVVRRGPSQEVVDAYLTEALPDITAVDAVRRPDQAVRLTQVECLDADGAACRTFLMGTALRLRITFEVVRAGQFNVECLLSNMSGVRVFGASSFREGVPMSLEPGVHTMEFQVPRITLNAGRYHADVQMRLEPDHSLETRVSPGPGFAVLPADMAGTGDLVQPWQGVFWLDHNWQR